MTSFTIEVKDDGVQSAPKALSARANNMAPVLQTIGEGIVERTKRRFETSTGPGVVKWQANSAATLAMLAGRLSGHKSKVKKDGSLNAAGQRAYGNKKPLIGESQDLRRQFTISASNGSLGAPALDRVIGTSGSPRAMQTCCSPGFDTKIAKSCLFVNLNQ